MQKSFPHAPGEAPGRVRGQDAEERPPGRHPGQRPLQHPDAELAIAQLGHNQGGESSIDREIGAEQNAADVRARGAENLTAGCRRQVQDRGRLAHEWQRRADARQAPFVGLDREMTGLTPGCHS